MLAFARMLACGFPLGIPPAAAQAELKSVQRGVEQKAFTLQTKLEM